MKFKVHDLIDNFGNFKQTSETVCQKSFETYSKTPELLTSYTKITQLIKFSILSLATRQDTRKFPMSTAVPVLTFPSVHGINVPDVANNDAEDVNAKNSKF